MNMKEAIRFQNKIQSFMDEAQRILAQDSNVTSRVDYEPPFDVNSSFAEASEAYTEKAGA